MCSGKCGSNNKISKFIRLSDSLLVNLSDISFIEADEDKNVLYVTIISQKVTLEIIVKNNSNPFVVLDQINELVEI